ncbi:MAG TPA: DNA helicase PcrA [Tepidimicrobium sp.]|nr:DNA helicase PcrA [Tepidimicrobium sp.]
MDYLKGLNDRQREAVLYGEGPLLVLAGAGSGKTKVLTHRIAYLIEQKGIFPGNMLAITFTNKAANEMKERTSDLLGGNIDGIWMGTFHSVCVRILRRYIDRIGFERGFSIYDRDDQIALMRECIGELDLREDDYKERHILNIISRIKDSMMSPNEYIDEKYMDPFKGNVKKLYVLYEEKLKDNNALDFDDLISKTVELFRTNPDVLEYYQQKFKYIFIDEFQDTNRAQYQLVKLLALGCKNLCVVGDDDQSIYGWRGADITNILSFEEDFPKAKIVKLEQNYRSTQNILDVANNIIKNNSGRMEKRLWTDNARGRRVVVENVLDSYEEAQFVIRKIEEHMREGYEPSDFAILYRTNAQSRIFEEAFMRNNIPYKLVGGLKFYDRKEIKDIVAYLRMIQNPVDDISLKRIINIPRRGIGKVTMEKLEEYANKIGTSIYDVLLDVENVPGLSTRAKNSLKAFVDMINRFIAMDEVMEIQEFIEEVVYGVGYIKELEDDGSIESQARLDNIKEFISVAIDFQVNNPEGTLEDFLANVSLLSDVDKTADVDNSVTLLTVHSAKGLEFPIVFMVGMEEGLFPIIRESEDKSEMEEERRLCYVAITRAEELLYISHARIRTIYGRTNYSRPSRFIDELPKELIDIGGQPNGGSYGRIGGNEAINPKEHLIKVKDLSERSVTPTRRSLIDQDQIREGVKVKHAKWGIGIVAQLRDRDDDKEATIIFDKVGMKRLLLSIAPIEIVKGG